MTRLLPPPSPPPPPSPLLSLPPELLLHIAHYLPPAATVALHLTNAYLHLLIRPRFERADLDDCAVLAIRSHFEHDDSDSDSDRQPLLKSPSKINNTNTSKKHDRRRRCRLCKSLYPAKLFSPHCAWPGELPARFCAWHASRLARVVAAADCDRQNGQVKDKAKDKVKDKSQGSKGGKLENRWVSRMEAMCMHCGSVQAWGGCRCECESCGVREVRTYTRFLDNERECKTFAFFRKEGGELWVRESCWSNGLFIPLLDCLVYTIALTV